MVSPCRHRGVAHGSRVADPMPFDAYASSRCDTMRSPCFSLFVRTCTWASLVRGACLSCTRSLSERRCAEKDGGGGRRGRGGGGVGRVGRIRLGGGRHPRGEAHQRRAGKAAVVNSRLARVGGLPFLEVKGFREVCQRRRSCPYRAQSAHRPEGSGPPLPPILGVLPVKDKFIKNLLLS